jgi:uncharacterized membrane protein
MNGMNPKSTASIAGHPIHPMLIPFPIAFLVTAFATDLAFWLTQDVIWATASMWLLGGGVVMGLLAALFGFTDFLGDVRIRNLNAAWQHMMGNLVAVVLALINWLIRYTAGAAAGVLPVGHLAIPRSGPAAPLQWLERVGNGLPPPRRHCGRPTHLAGSKASLWEVRFGVA